MTTWVRAIFLTVGLGLGSVGHATEVAALYQASYDLESIHDYAGALKKMDEIGAVGEDYIYRLRRGWLLYLLGRYGDSATSYRAAVEAAPESLEARQGLVLPLMAMKQWSDAETICKALLEVAPADYRGNSRLAYIQYNMGHYADAADRYRRILALYPSDVEMRAGLGWAELKQGNADAARRTFEAVLRVAPGHGSAREGLDAVQ
jgi:tetratricopeptide (TPR) repeat protein